MSSKPLASLKRTFTLVITFLFIFGTTISVWLSQPYTKAQADTDQPGPVFTVNSTIDDMGDVVCITTHCSLRGAITAANAIAGDNTIVFAIGENQTITLTSQLPGISALNGALTIDGETHTPIISGDNNYRVIKVENNAQFTLTHITLTNGNYTGGDCSPSACGGALKVNSGATANLTDVVIRNSTSNSGGAIFNAGTANLTDVSIQDNSADEGGGILNYGGTLSVNTSVIKNNTALFGGGILQINGSIEIKNSTVSGNSATGSSDSGGGGAIDLYSGSLTLNFVTISSNTAVSPNQARSGLWLEGGSVNMKNSIVALNNSSNNFYQTMGAYTSQGYNLSNAWNGLTTIATDLTGDPKLNSLADNGGKTSTSALMGTSPAIDAANPEGCLATDQRGFSRPSGACDIGAFEFQKGPTGISLSSASIQENQPADTSVGTISTSYEVSNEPFTYSLVSGTGSTDNNSFNISGASLRASSSLDYETKNSYSIRIRSTDKDGFFFDKAFVISVTNVNEAPTDIALSASSVNESASVNTVVGALSSTDPDSGNTFTYTLVSGTGSTGNASFNISGNNLRTSSTFDYETQNSYSIRVRSTDQGGLWNEEAFTISITRPLSDITLTNTEATTAQSIIGTLDSVGGQKTFTYTLQNSGSICNGTNGADNLKFAIDGSALRRSETTLTGTYHICLQTKDSNLETFQKNFTIEITSAPSPSSTWTVELSSDKVIDGDPAGTLVGSVISSVTGTTFQLIDASIFPQNSAFNLTSSGSLTLAVKVDITLQNFYPIRIQATTPDARTKNIDAVIKVMKNGNASGASAGNDNAVVVVGGQIEVDVQANDTMSTGAASWKTLEIVRYPYHGSAQIGSIIYAPESGYTGSDIVTYRSCDNLDACVVGELNLIVRSPSITSQTMPASGFSPNHITYLPEKPASLLYSKKNEMSLSIPSIGINTPVVGVPLTESGWDISWLGESVGWLHGSAFPTWNGNSVLTGHIYDSDGTPGIFIDLDKLRWGDEVIIKLGNHSYVYEVQKIIDNVDPSKIETLMTHKDNPWLTLVTCKGYDEETDSYHWRYLVRAVLIRIE